MTIVKEAGNPDATRAQVYPLLKATHIISLDLATSTRQSEALMKSLLTFAAKTTQKTKTAARTWKELVTVAAEAATDANDSPGRLAGENSA